MLSPRSHALNIPDTPTRTPAYLGQSPDDDIDSIPTPSSKWNGRPGKRSPVPRSESKWVKKGKAKSKAEGEAEGSCFLLDLPDDVLQLLLSRLPARSLVALAGTCQTLRRILEDESIWRSSYINRFFWDGATQVSTTKSEVKVLVQSCKGGSLGWRKEALGRESMLERWISSKATPVTHTPPVGLVHTLSLSYPAFTPAPAPKLVVGKNHPVSSEVESPSPSPMPTPTPKMTHRQKYEALLAATTRPAPYILSAGLGVGGVVRSDPLSGKVSKGFWGPGRDANFHLRPHLDNLASPSAVSLPLRNQSHVLWGLLNGNVVHTTILTKHTSTHGGRASSLNVCSDPSDGHDGVISDIYTPDDGETFVTAGEDGKVKLWRLHPGQNLTKSGKKSPGVESVPARVECVWSSGVVHSSLERSDVVKLRQMQAPDAIILARAKSDTVCGVTADGDLRIWTSGVEHRIDVGAEELEGPVKIMELDVYNGEVSVLIHHRLAPSFTRYGLTSSKRYETVEHLPLTCLRAYLDPTPPISGSEILPLSFGRFIVGGDQSGGVHIWSWDTATLMRSFSAMSSKITAVDYSCGILAVGSCDGWIKVYDPLPSPPVLLRSFHANHLSPADTRVAMSEEFDAVWFNVNKITLENDLLVAAIGRKVFAWRAGSAKGRQSGKKEPRKSSGSGLARGNNRALDMKAINRDAADSHLEIQSQNEAMRTPSRREADELAAMEDLGLDDGDEALQYALMLSMEGGESPPGEESFDEDAGSEDEAVRAVEEYTRSEERQILEALHRIDRAEQQNR